MYDRQNQARHDMQQAMKAAEAQKCLGDPIPTQIGCNGERPVIETMAITANRLEDIERKLNMIHSYLFGPEPVDCCDTECGAPSNVRSLAGSAFSATVRLERLLDEIYKRLAN